jgi:DNA-directed RNA polymerase subunit RPC12/RpoP
MTIHKIRREKMSNQCPYCGSLRNVCISPVLLKYVCLACEKFFSKGEQPEQSVFNRITQSPEVLAEEFVEPYTRWGEDGYLETLWRSNFRELSGMLFDTKEEALAATVERLKEVEDE